MENAIATEMFDSHAHLAENIYDSDLNNIIDNAAKNNVLRIMCVGDTEANSKKSVEIAKKNNGVYTAVGIHPHDSQSYNGAIEINLKKLLEEPKVLAVGEIGLDYYKMYSPKNFQIETFRRQMDLALANRKPVILHCRDAYEDMINIMREYKDVKGVVHCFSGNTDQARIITDMGYYIGITGAITFKKAQQLYNVVKNTSIEKMLVETDCPFISPEPFRGKRNEPANIPLIVKAISLIKDLSFDDTARITDFNAKSLFKLQSDQSAQIAYSIRKSLYLNITNICPNKCNFCARNKNYFIKGHYLKLEHEPDFNEIVDALGKKSDYEEIVFCGFGEPTARIELLLKIASYLKRNSQKIRLNTNGLGNLINNRDILPEMKGLIDAISISLNAQNAEIYNKVCMPDNPEEAYQSIISFAHSARLYIPKVIISVVNLPEVDIEACKKIADSIGAEFKIRSYVT